MTSTDRDRLDPIISPELAALTSQLPPASLDAEMRVIGGVLLDPPMYERLDWLTPADFSDSNYQTIWTAIAAVVNETQKSPDLMAVSAWLKSKGKLDRIGGLPTLAQLVSSIISSAEAESAAIILREMRDRRNLIEAGFELQKLAYDRLSPVGKLYDRAREYLSPLMQESGVMSGDDLDTVRCYRLVEQVKSLLLDPNISPANRLYKFRKLSKKTGFKVGELKEIYYGSLIEELNEPMMSIADLRETYGDQIDDWVLPGVYPRGRSSLLIASGGTGKTLFAYDTAYSLATGLDWQGFPVLKKQKVLIIQTDESPADLLQNLETRGFDPISPNVRVKTRWDVNYISHLYEEIKEWRPDFVLVDSLTSVSQRSLINENDKEYATPLLHLADIARETNCHICIIHHANKATGEARGSGAIEASVSQVMRITRVSDDPTDTRRYLTFGPKMRSRRPAVYLMDLDPETKAWALMGEVSHSGVILDDPNATAKERVLKLLRQYEGTPFCAADITESLRLNKDTVRKSLGSLSADKVINAYRPQGSRYKVYFVGDIKKSPTKKTFVPSDPPSDPLIPADQLGGSLASQTQSESCDNWETDPQNQVFGLDEGRPKTQKTGSSDQLMPEPALEQGLQTDPPSDPPSDPPCDPPCDPPPDQVERYTLNQKIIFHHKESGEDLLGLVREDHINGYQVMPYVGDSRQVAGGDLIYVPDGAIKGVPPKGWWQVKPMD